MTRRAVQSAAVEIPGPSGRLEAAIDSVARAPRAIAVLCHPHPLQHGSMSNKVVTTLSRAFAHLGAHAVRFNFRGVGRSDGAYADGVGERDDALAVVDWARARWPGCRLYVGGFSFGAAIALSIAAPARADGLVTVAPPADRLPADLVLPRCRWLLVHGGADDVVPFASTAAWMGTLDVRPHLVRLEGVGHFFHGKLPVLEETVRDYFAGDFGTKAADD